MQFLLKRITEEEQKLHTNHPDFLYSSLHTPMHGKALYTALFPPWSPAYQALAKKPPRILLVAADDVLDAIPWEYTSPAGPSGSIACSCSFVRGLPTEQRNSPPAMLSELHIVAVASSPLSRTLAPLNIGGEWTRLTEIVGGRARRDAGTGLAVHDRTPKKNGS